MYVEWTECDFTTSHLLLKSCPVSRVFTIVAFLLVGMGCCGKYGVLITSIHHPLYT